MIDKLCPFRMINTSETIRRDSINTAVCLKERCQLYILRPKYSDNYVTEEYICGLIK
jgi:hypothetical protein